jgi:putative sugar O-methyltransferase
MYCIIPRANLVRNIGFDAKATHTVERDFMNLKMHSIHPMSFPLSVPTENECRLSMDNLVFKQHYQKLQGRRSLLEKIRDRIKRYIRHKAKSSISDTDNYRLACLEAANNEESFSIFKQDSRYKEILEHTDYRTGLLYLEEIKKNTKIFESINNFSANDRLGNPEVFIFPEIGLFSPSTLRYVKVLADLVKKFKDLSDLKITEIGGGYGGQCLIIHQHAIPKSYRIYDLPEPLLLTEKYLKKNNVEKTKLCILEKPIGLPQSSCLESDLLISNYAFSEINCRIQKTYLEKVIMTSKKGYMTMNSISEVCGVDSMPFNHVIRTLEARGPVKVETEKPLTFRGNQIIWWDWS